MMESQEVEALPVGEVHDAGLVGMQTQPELFHFVFEDLKGSLSLGAPAAHDHEIICVAHELPEPAMMCLPVPVEPVQVHVREQRRNDPALRSAGV